MPGSGSDDSSHTKLQITICMYMSPEFADTDSYLRNIIIHSMIDNLTLIK